MLNNRKAVIFDLDGTLVDSMWIWKQIDIDFLKRYKIEFPKDLQLGIEGMSFSETAAYFKERFQIPDSVEEIKKEWNLMALDIYCSRVPLKKGVLDFLIHCKRKGIKMGIATSNSPQLVKAILESLKIEDYFQVVKTACEVGKGKPSPDIYLLAAKELGVDPQECLVFEDIIHGIQAGLSAGMKVCAVEDEYSIKDRVAKKELANYFIDDFTEINLA